MYLYIRWPWLASPRGGSKSPAALLSHISSRWPRHFTWHSLAALSMESRSILSRTLREWQWHSIETGHSNKPALTSAYTSLTRDQCQRGDWRTGSLTAAVCPPIVSCERPCRPVPLTGLLLGRAGGCRKVDQLHWTPTKR